MSIYSQQELTEESVSLLECVHVQNWQQLRSLTIQAFTQTYEKNKNALLIQFCRYAVVTRKTDAYFVHPLLDRSKVETSPWVKTECRSGAFADIIHTVLWFSLPSIQKELQCTASTMLPSEGIFQAHTQSGLQ